MTNREFREIQSEDFEKSLSWSFSVEKVSEMVIPPGLCFQSSDALFVNWTLVY